MTQARDDHRLMALALALGRRNNGRTWPNPSVGAVVVDAGGSIVAQGVTEPGGRPHAERVALARAGERARGATLYVSLEPCSHYGRTPPCTDAIREAGIARVVTALEDPDPRVAGRGHAILREAGIAVTTGLRADEARRAHLGHLTRVRQGRPAIVLKLARTADGFAAAGPGEPRLMISGEGTFARTHMLRAHSDAIMVGVDTVLADDPRLNVRLPGLEHRSPLPVILDTHLRTPPGAFLIRQAIERPVWIVAGEGASGLLSSRHAEERPEGASRSTRDGASFETPASPAPQHDEVGDPGSAEHRLAAAGAEIVRAPVGPDGRIALPAALRLLAERGLTRIFCEGGPTLADALAELDAIDRLFVATSARPLGRPGRVAIGPALARSLGLTLILAGTETVGPDTIVRYERASCSPGS